MHTIVAHPLEAALANTRTDNQATVYKAWHKQRHPGLPGRAYGVAIDCARKFPGFTEMIIGRQLPVNMTRIGAGSSSIAYQRGTEITKIYPRTAGMSATERQVIAAEEIVKYDSLCSYLGDIVLPTVISVGPDPVKPSRDVVQILQPAATFDCLDDVFPRRSTKINAAALQMVLSQQPHLDESFYTIASQGLAMSAETAFMPDLMGRSNIGTTKEQQAKVVLVDTIPMSTNNDWAEDFLLPQLQSLQDYLDAPHV